MAPLVMTPDSATASPRFESLPVAFRHQAPHAAATPAVRVRRASRSVAPRSVVAATTAPQPAAAAEHLSCTQQCGLDVQCILACPSPGSAGNHAVVGNAPTRDQVATAMQQVRGAVTMCGTPLRQGPRTARVDVTFAPSGNVHEAAVEAPYAGTMPGDCIEHAVQHAHVPRFNGPSFEVSYPFNVR
jgi:hypothetical protein